MINLVECIQKNLGFASLNKVDPNTQEVDETKKSFGTNALAQAAIPAVVYGFCNAMLQPHRETASLLPEHGKWLSKIFGNKKNDMVERVAGYTGLSVTNVEAEMEHIAAEAGRLINENLPANQDTAVVRTFAIDHKNDAVAYLPAALRIGELLGDDTIDDRTNKMEGPISSLMHKFEQIFSNDTKER